LAGPSLQSSCIPKILITIGLFENVDQRYWVDVVVIKFRIMLQHRPFSEGEGIRGMRLDEQNY
jgi:hypothetical protein